ncbi:ABC transporter permease [Caldicellulosiruptor acetigenus]|uniref:ABC-type transporter, integral membrane subunit n=1 Tax=Caldicellulosiruptor acetigenus 6A TaxID=632516 RepID=G2PVN9_9FIRM|nr:ABC transporter permease subunit [Caldicellulosiruptor acetigenus]AEM72783.1 ABC-type transporter, integral membrane subunit [Caldicellulosiruptor acetigenus 6A]
MEKAAVKSYQPNRWQELKKDLMRNKSLYIMLIPVVAYYFIFHYIPMYGLQIAFKDFTPAKGIWGSPWVGFEKFKEFFVYDSFYVWRIIRNTLLINLYQLIFGFPAPIIFALLLNEVKNSLYKRTLQTVSYMPHFISTVVIVGIILDFFSTDGLINHILKSLGIVSEPISFMTEPGWFRPIYVGSGIWQQLGWSSIIYLAAISNIDPQLYEAATIDGAGRFRQVLHVTIPGIMPTIIILLILNMGRMMSEGPERVLLMYNPLTYETADIISTYVYRKGLLELDYSYGAAVGLFNSVINFLLVVFSNKIAKKLTETSLW